MAPKANDDLKNFIPSDYGIYNDDGGNVHEEDLGEVGEDYAGAPVIPAEDTPEVEEVEAEY